MIREAVFAGTWYPGTKADLEAFLARTPPRDPEPALGVIAPHAGFRYSGAIAAETYARVVIPETVVVLCPNHRVPPPVLSVWARGAWRTPLGEVPIDEALAARLVAEAQGRLTTDTFPHAKEHAIELHLPFLQHRRPDVRIVPIVVATSELAAFGEVLARVARGSLIVASSDMNHFESATIARAKDSAALERILALDPEGLRRVVDERDISMCGVRPAVALLHAARALGAKKAELVRYGHSGEVSGDLDSVVGYAGVVVR